MNSKMKEAIATVRYVLDSPGGLLGAARDEARNALDMIEAELAVPAPMRKLTREEVEALPLLPHQRTMFREGIERAESDYAAAKRAHGLTLEADAYVPANPATGDRARLVAVIARPVDEDEAPKCAECGGPLPPDAIADGSSLCSPECVDDYYPGANE